MYAACLFQSFENSSGDNERQGITMPATKAQKDFIGTLNEQTGNDVQPAKMDRGEASDAIEKMKPQAEEKQVSSLCITNQALLTPTCRPAAQCTGD